LSVSGGSSHPFATLRGRAPARVVWSLLMSAAMTVASGLAACGAPKEDPILRLSATEALDTGKELLAQGKFREARRYLIHAFEVEPNSSAGRDGLLFAADALFQQGGFDSYVEAETRYRDFLNRFPTSPRADYAQFRIAVSLAERMEKPSRDQETARKALQAIEDLQRSFPLSPHIEEARQHLQEVRDNLAEHEYYVAHFYYRYGRPRATIARLEYLMETYPDFGAMDKALALQCQAYDRAELDEKALETCERLRREHPDSRYVGKVQGRPKPGRGQREGDAPEAPAEEAPEA
jgi:outer membrane protein assembly factor BamD